MTRRSNTASNSSRNKHHENDERFQQNMMNTDTCKIELKSSLAINLFARRALMATFLCLLGMLSVHQVVVQKSGKYEIHLINDIMEKNGFTYAHSILSSQQNRNPNTRPGYMLRQQGATAVYPVVLIPGFITSGLELWDGEQCAKGYFRQRLWGSLPVFVQSFFTDNECWRRHLSLNPKTGMDPENIRLRSAQGFEAADYVMSTFWVWEKIIENLADVGYDSSNMLMMPYDWRLSFVALEKRDGYLTKLKMNIEAMVKTSGKKVVITSHSMGSQIVLFFFKWVTTCENENGGGGGKDWVDKHVHSFVNIAGPVLGVPKAVTALLSGEMKDTAAMMGTMGSFLEVIFGRSNRNELWKTWGSLWAMLPKGGDAIWSNAGDILERDQISESDENERNHDPMNQAFIMFDESDDNINETEKTSWTINDSIQYLQHWGRDLEHSLHAAKVHEFQSNGRLSIENWHDPTVTPLPVASSLKIYCLYGVGIETERAYYYKRFFLRNDTIEDLPFIMDTTIHDPDNNIRFGIRFSDGDVSVPLVSLGYMCVEGWKDAKLNPSKLKIVTREYLHREEFHVNDPMRGGPLSADHVDILGNVETTLDLLKVVTDFNVTSVGNLILSDIKKISTKIKRKGSKPKVRESGFKLFPFL